MKIEVIFDYLYSKLSIKHGRGRKKAAKGAGTSKKAPMAAKKATKAALDVKEAALDIRYDLYMNSSLGTI